MNEYRLDNRSSKDIKSQIKNLAKNYVPEWNFDENNPDIGSVLALLFSNQLKGNIDRYNLMLEKYHTQMVNLMDISLLPAHPAKATVLMDLYNNTVSGVKVEKGTKLLADEGDEKIVFETSYPVYMTGSSIKALYMTSAENGKVLPIFGDFKSEEYIPDMNIDVIDEIDTKESDIDDTNNGFNSIPKFTAFDFKKKGIEKNAFLIYYDSIFDVENEMLDCKIIGNDQFLQNLSNGKYSIKYFCEDDFIPIEDFNVVNEHIYFSKKKKSKKINVDGNEYNLLVFEALDSVSENIVFDSIEFSSTGAAKEVDYVGNGTTDFNVNNFNVFGDTLSIYSECYIGMDSYFSKKDSNITLTFETSFPENFVGLVKEEEKLDLRIIKRKPRLLQEETMAYSYAQEISIEYFNGIGWKRLKCDLEYSRIFENANADKIQLSFVCPSDWVESSTGSYSGRVLRIQLLKADNCYYQPCIHCYPKIKNLKVEYSYEDNYKKPIVGKRFYGSTYENVTKNINENKPFVAFSSGNYNDTAIYIGFDKVLDNGPISLWWKLKDSLYDAQKDLKFYYSTNSEFKEMKIIDYTDNLSKTGVMLFIPEADMGMLTLENKKLCWIKIVDENVKKNKVNPIVERLAINAVEVKNIETLEEEEFYIDNVNSNMSFPIRADKILDAQVWVNEVNDLSQNDMKLFMETYPDKVKVSYDYLGEIEEFFVKWEECSNFNFLKNNSRNYILDRMQNRIIFGDGINVKIPRNTDGVAFIIQARCCNGKNGNVPENSITKSSSNLLFINNIYNPNPAYGGSDIESLDNALERGASLLSSGGRYVTEKDYIDEIMNFSEIIEDVRINNDIDRYGNYSDGMMHIVLLMKDFMESSSSFYSIQHDLKKHLLKHCELSILPEKLLIEEPIFVELSVDVWISIVKLDDSFEIQNCVEEVLESYLNPIAGKYNKGWGIGYLPRKSQIIMKLNSIKSKGIINHIMINAKYTDEKGTHEVDLEDLIVSPFMVVKNGNHKIHIRTEGRVC